MYKAIVFDFGNTLAGTTSLTKASASVIGSEKAEIVGAEIEGEIKALYNPSQKEQPNWVEIWERSFTRAGLKFDENLGREHLLEFCRSNVTFPDVPELLARLRGTGIKIGLLSNVTGPPDIFQSGLENRKLAVFFDSVIWSSAIGYRKPSSQAFEAVLADLGVSPAEALMVGDSELADIQGAVKIGMDAALVTVH